MEDKNKSTSEFENLVKEATTELPVVKEETKEEIKENKTEIENTDSIKIIEDGSPVEETEDDNSKKEAEVKESVQDL